MPCNEIISNVDPTPYYSSLISNYCIKTQNLKLGKLLHSHFIKTALTLNVFLTNRLIDMYSKCNSLICAQKAFDDLPTKNTHSWNTIISAYSQMGRFDVARNMLDEMPEPNVVSYNSLISGLSHHGFYKESIRIFRRMQKVYNGVTMDDFTLISVVRSCAYLGALEMVRQLHGVAEILGGKLNVAFYNAMIDAYGKCGDPTNAFLIFNQMVERDVVSWTSMVVAYARGSRLEDASWVFNQMPTKNTISWTSLISGFAQNGRGDEALDIFKKMQEEKIQPNAFTFVSVLSACADLALLDRGKQLHGHITRTPNLIDKFNVFLCNALIDMYCKCGEIKSARTLFEGMPEKDIVSWNSLITGFAQNGNGDESLVFFKKMIVAGIKPNHATFVGVLSACNHKGLEYEGQHMLKSMEKDYSLSPRTDHYAILIDLLGRRNKLKEAMELIEKAPNGIDHVGIWGSLLGACRMHGNLDLALRASAALLELEPQNAGRHVMLSNVYAAAGKWDDARRVRELMERKGLTKEAAHSWIELRNTRYHFVAKDKSCSEMEEICDLLDNLVDQMKEDGFSPHDKFPFPGDGVS